jgi:hypothetical protein
MKTYRVSAYVTEGEDDHQIDSITVQAARAAIAEFSYAAKLEDEDTYFDFVVATETRITSDSK